MVAGQLLWYRPSLRIELDNILKQTVVSRIHKHAALPVSDGMTNDTLLSESVATA